MGGGLNTNGAYPDVVDTDVVVVVVTVVVMSCGWRAAVPSE
jgi:hypothetical protein